MQMTKILSFALIGSIFLAGCEQSSDYQSHSSTSLPFEVAKAEKTTAPAQPLSDEQVELQKMLKEMQAKDPSIVDAYYSYDENGEKFLTVVQEDGEAASSEGGSGLSTFMWAMAGGLAANALFNSFSSGGMKGMVNSHKPYSSSMVSRSQYLSNKNLGTQRYGSFSNTKPFTNSAVKQPVTQATTKPATNINSSQSNVAPQKAKPVTVVKKKPMIKPRKKSFRSFGFGGRKRR